MAVTVLATVAPPFDAAPFTGDVTRPGYSGATNQGWNNRVGDPAWIPDYDWYRRIQLVCAGNAGEDTRTVNWECYDGTLQFKTNADMATAKAGAVASPYGTTVNNSDTWTVWATTGVATAAADKYTDTKTPCISKLRANGQRVQVMLGPRKNTSLVAPNGVATTWTVAAFLPGAGKIPTATATVTVVPPTAAGQPNASPYALEDGEDEPQVTATEEDVEAEPEIIEELPDSSWTKSEIADWLVNQGVDAEDGQTKKELLALVQDVVDAEEPSDE